MNLGFKSHTNCSTGVDLEPLSLSRVGAQDGEEVHRELVRPKSVNSKVPVGTTLLITL